MDPARLLHRLGVLLLVSGLLLVPVVLLAALFDGVMGWGAGTYVVWSAGGLLGGMVVYGFGIAWELVRDGRQAAGLK